ncbi:MAG TPA: hypothetical protein VNJ71_12595 [Gemmatimonadales bacterium]|nr:hypothetical protein [Gemmatimonadales bacterium]
MTAPEPRGDGVFHPGHSELHGVTVVLETRDGTLYVGRYHEATPAGVLLHDVAEHRPAPGGPDRTAFIQRMLEFGVRAHHRHLMVPGTDVRRVVRLVEWREES